MKLRIQHRSIKKVIEVADDATLAQLIDAIESAVNEPKFTIKSGFPPRLLDINDPTVPLKAAGLRSGESLLIEIQSSTGKTDQATSAQPFRTRGLDGNSQIPDAPVQSSGSRKKEILQGGFSFSGTQAESAVKDETLPPEVSVPGRGTLTLRVQPDDNSCLFRAIGYLCMRSIDAMEELRALIATTIQANPDEYSDAVLGMKRDLYCTKMNRADTWGGEIEIQILSNHFNVQIVNIDCKTGHIYRYGENFDECIYIVYSGIHYDALAMSPAENTPPEWDQTQFPSTDTAVEKAALQLVAILRERNYFTDTANFDLRCNNCGVGLRGEKGAQDHAMKTGHVSFGEYKS